MQLAKSWSNRPPVKEVTTNLTLTTAIPDDSLRVVCAASGLPASLASIHSLPSQGPHPDDPTPTLPLVYVGQANSEIAQDLHGKGALIQRGVSFFSDKIARAARAAIFISPASIIVSIRRASTPPRQRASASLGRA